MALTFDSQAEFSMEGLRFRAVNDRDDLIVFGVARPVLFDHFHAKSQGDFAGIYQRRREEFESAALTAYTADSSAGQPIELTHRHFQ